MARKALIATMVLFVTAGCAMVSPPLQPPEGTSVSVEEEDPWRSVAAEGDARAIDALPEIWAMALADARRAGFFRRVVAEGALLVPAAGLPRAEPAPGPYSCRIVRLGAQAPDVRAWSQGGQGFCFVGAEPEHLSLTIEAGPRRMGGYLWEGRDSRRLVFLGAQSPRGSPIGGYGDDRMHDVAGLFERIGPFRYRLTLPSDGEHRLTIIELRPAEGAEGSGPERREGKTIGRAAKPVRALAPRPASARAVGSA